MAAAMSEGDREMVAASKGGRVDHAEGDVRYRLRYLDIPPDIYDGYYNRISNGILWFAHHYLWDTVTSPSFGPDVDEAWQAYVDVNRRFATALAEEGDALGGDTAFLIQDYHLSLVPRMLRELVPDALIAHFSHTSIAGPTYFRMLPTQMHDQVLWGLLGADVLGFHSPAWAENFMLRARQFPGVRVDLARSRIVTEGRVVTVRIHPISVDGRAMREEAATPRVREPPSCAQPVARQQPPDPARRPARAHEERRARVPGLRALPAPQPVVDRTGSVPRAVVALADGAARVPRVHGGLPRGGPPGERRARP